MKTHLLIYRGEGSPHSKWMTEEEALEFLADNPDYRVLKTVHVNMLEQFPAMSLVVLKAEILSPKLVETVTKWRFE